MQKNRLINFSAILFLLAIATSCHRDNELPSLKTCQNVKISDIGRKNIEIKGELIFDNPNDRSYAYKRSIIEFNINGKDIGSEIDREKLEVMSSQNLKLPFKHSFPIERLRVDTLGPEMIVLKIKGELELVNGEQKKLKIDFNCDVDLKVKDSQVEKIRTIERRKAQKNK